MSNSDNDYFTYLLEALAVFSRSPSAFRALRSLGILSLPCDKTLKGYMHQHSSSPGINERCIKESSEKYANHVKEKVKKGHKAPLKEGILIWDETKVYIHVFTLSF